MEIKQLLKFNNWGEPQVQNVTINRGLIELTVWGNQESHTWKLINEMNESPQA